MLSFINDQFNGVIVTLDKTDSIEVFDQTISSIIKLSKQHKKQLIWITLNTTEAQFIATLTHYGFVFHNCQEHELTLILRLKADAYAPFVPTHTIGAGGLVINEKNQILLIKDNYSTYQGFKLPGGHVDLTEDIAPAAIREVYEETGIKCEFESIVALAAKHPYKYGKSNIYFVCKLKPINHDISILQPEEIADAQWIDLETYLADENNSLFNRQIIKQVLNKQGLKSCEFQQSKTDTSKRELFLAL